MSGPQWVRLDVGYFGNRKILRAGRDAALLHLAAICYLGDQESPDGVLPSEEVEHLARRVKVRRGEAVPRLVKYSLWHDIGDGDYLVHDWDVINGAKSEAAHAKERQRRRRAKQRAAESNGGSA